MGFVSWNVSADERITGATPKMGYPPLPGGLKGGGSFFKGAKYSDKALRQMSNKKDVGYAFPKSVDGFASKYGKFSTVTDKYGNKRLMLNLNGSYRGKNGVFEYMKNDKGEISHRFFKTK